MRAAILAGAALLFTTLGSSASAQTLPAGDEREDYLRVLQILGRADVGSMTVRPLPLEEAEAALRAPGHPWSTRWALGSEESKGAISPTDVHWRMFANTSFPVGQNDGAVWQGKGLTTSLEGGAHLRWGGLSATVRPALIYNQNSPFELAQVTVAGQPEYAYPWAVVDLPQRFGPEGFWTVDPGQSDVRLRAFGVTAGLAHGNLWWGPGRFNGILMSNHAPGFMHGFLGTDGAVDIGIGRLEAAWIWGDLDHSEWLRPEIADTDRFLTGIVATYSPSFLPGLSLGASRVYYLLEPEAGIPLKDYFLVFQGVRKEFFETPDNIGGNDERDQLLSLFGRWVIPEGGFEVYWEWARNDHSWNFREFALEPDHSQGYVLGLQKAIELSGSVLALSAELTHLDRTATSELRATPSYYVHHLIRQGYTNEGQVIGAGVGPGGNAQRVGADLFATWGRAGVFLGRDARDNDAFYRWAAANGGTRWDHDIWLHAGGHGSVFVGPWELSGSLMLTRELNRYFYWRDLWNLNASLGARWYPR